MSFNKTRPTRVEFLAFAVFIVVSAAFAALSYSYGGMDFGVYYAAGRVFLQGGNPYEYSQLAGEIVSSTGELNNPYYYAPWFTWALAPLALLPYALARLCWALLNYLFWLLALGSLAKLGIWHTSGWQRWGANLFVTILFAWSTWGSEQVGVLILLLVVAAVIAYQREQPAAMGAWMALLLFKPNITAFPILILVFWLLLRRRWQVVAWMSGILLAMFAASVMVSPGWYLALLQPDKLTGLSYTLNETGEVQVQRYTSTFMDWLAAYNVTGGAANVLYALAIMIGFASIGRIAYRTNSPLHLTAYALLINFALIPYALFYDYASLTLSLFFINAALAKQPALIWLQRTMNILIAASLFVGGNISQRYWIVVILLACAALGRIIVPADENT